MAGQLYILIVDIFRVKDSATLENQSYLRNLLKKANIYILEEPTLRDREQPITNQDEQKLD